MELTVLGCGDAFGNGGRNNTSFLITNDEEGVLIDCGATTLVRLKQEKIDLASISTIIITHFHGDHYGGLPFFLISKLFELQNDNPLTIIGPKGIEKRTLQLQEAMYSGTEADIKKLNLIFLEYAEGKSLEIGDKVVHAFEVNHSPPSNPHGIRLEWRGKKIAFSGDTSWTDKLIPLSADADLFICECNFMDSVSFGHLSYEEIHKKRSSFECKELWLTHMNDEVYFSDQITINRLKDGLKILF